MLTHPYHWHAPALSTLLRSAYSLRHHYASSGQSIHKSKGGHDRGSPRGFAMCPPLDRGMFSYWHGTVGFGWKCLAWSPGTVCSAHRVVHNACSHLYSPLLLSPCNTCSHLLPIQPTIACEVPAPSGHALRCWFRSASVDAVMLH